jgi:hypothetical protein
MATLKMTPNVKTPATSNIAMTGLPRSPSPAGSTNASSTLEVPKTDDGKKKLRIRALYFILSFCCIAALITVIAVISVRRPKQKPEETTLKQLPKGVEVFEAPLADLWEDGKKVKGAEEKYIALATADAQLYEVARNHVIWEDKKVKPVVEEMGLENIFGKLGAGAGYIRCDWPRKEKHGAKRIGDAIFREQHMKGEGFVLFWNKTIRSCYVMTEEMLTIQRKNGGKNMEWMKD